jgi:hypothetical protein
MPRPIVLQVYVPRKSSTLEAWDASRASAHAKRRLSQSQVRLTPRALVKEVHETRTEAKNTEDTTVIEPADASRASAHAKRRLSHSQKRLTPRAYVNEPHAMPTGTKKAEDSMASEAASKARGAAKAAWHANAAREATESSALELRTGGYSAAKAVAAIGADNAAALIKAGYTHAELRKAHVRAAHLLGAGVDAAALRAAGYGARELVGAGVDAKSLRNAGYVPHDLIAARVELTEC